MKKLNPLLFLVIFLLVFQIGCDDDNPVTITIGEIIEPPPLGMIGNEASRVTKNGIEHVIHISVDGLTSAAITTLGIDKLPGFYYMRSNGSYTDNARTDDQIAFTIPNHSSQFSGRAAYGLDGHNILFNNDVSDSETTVHSTKGSYIASIFDMVHDFGLSTSLYTGKSKFTFFKNSWNNTNGAIDRILPDSGRSKIDNFVYIADTDILVDTFINDLTMNQYNYAFLHLKDPDEAGHAFNWSLDTDSEYLKAVEKVDAKISAIINLISTNLDFKDSTVLIVTADHGGILDSNTHFLSITDGDLESSVIPFYIYGVNVPTNTDLYTWNPGKTIDPGANHPLFVDLEQPIRNGDIANLCMKLLGLPDIPNSRINNLDYPW